MLNLHPLECTIKDNDHIPDLLLIKYWGIISCKYAKCTKLTSLVIGEKVKEIGEWAFKATKLKEIHIKALAPPTIEHDTFSDYAYSSATLYVPKGSKKVYQNANVWKEFHNIIEE